MYTWCSYVVCHFLEIFIIIEYVCNKKNINPEKIRIQNPDKIITILKLYILNYDDINDNIKSPPLHHFNLN